MAENDDRLNSWKQIASALNREVRTVQMWEKHEGLPIHRHFHNRRSTVFASRAEIESWARRRTEIRMPGKAMESAPQSVSGSRILVLLPAVAPTEKSLVVVAAGSSKAAGLGNRRNSERHRGSRRCGIPAAMEKNIR
jgi:hypothetical protein